MGDIRSLMEAVQTAVAVPSHIYQTINYFQFLKQKKLENSVQIKRVIVEEAIDEKRAWEGSNL